MAKFRKRPVVIDAVHYVGVDQSRLAPEDVNATELMEFMGVPRGKIDLGRVSQADDFSATGALLIATPEGKMRCGAGNWLVRGVDGEFYPVRDDIFRATYDRVVAGGSP